MVRRSRFPETMVPRRLTDRSTGTGRDCGTHGDDLCGHLCVAFPVPLCSAGGMVEARGCRATLPTRSRRVCRSTRSGREHGEACEVHPRLRRSSARLAEARPDVLLIFGDDQLEQFDFGNLPAFCVFIGESISGYRISPYFGLPVGRDRPIATEDAGALGDAGGPSAVRACGSSRSSCRGASTWRSARGPTTTASDTRSRGRSSISCRARRLR